MNIDKNAFAKKWIESWNSHDVESILQHYSEDVEVTSPMIKVVFETGAGTLRGIEKVKDYWIAALKKAPDLKFELLDVARSIDSIAIYYKAVMNKMAIEVMFFDNKGLIKKVIVHYQ